MEHLCYARNCWGSAVRRTLRHLSLLASTLRVAKAIGRTALHFNVNVPRAGHDRNHVVRGRT